MIRLERYVGKDHEYYQAFDEDNDYVGIIMVRNSEFTVITPPDDSKPAYTTITRGVSALHDDERNSLLSRAVVSIRAYLSTQQGKEPPRDWYLVN